MLCDAHCHPTDHPEFRDAISQMRTSTLTAMSTNLSDLDIVADWASDERIIPAFGFHPWYTHLLSVGNISKEDHYRDVLKPKPSDDFIAALPDPVSLETYVQKLRDYLTKFPRAIVGEIGLDKSFRVKNIEKTGLSPYRVSPQHQVAIFRAQVEVAAEMERPISVHGVQCHGLVLNTIKSLSNKLPPAICLHSYSGSPGFLEEWLTLSSTRVYISFSSLVNIPTDEKAYKIVLATPQDRILTESDYHSAGKEMDRLNEEALTRVCKAMGWSLTHGLEQVYSNFQSYVGKERLP